MFFGHILLVFLVLDKIYVYFQECIGILGGNDAVAVDLINSNKL